MQSVPLSVGPTFAMHTKICSLFPNIWLTLPNIVYYSLEPLKQKKKWPTGMEYAQKKITEQ